jgi:hypothetical protein
MPKCLDCNNTKTFTYLETSYNEALYDEAGDLQDVFYNEYAPVTDKTCYECKSINVEGDM